jgi:hypothetical protein
MSVESVLKSRYPAPVVDRLLEACREIEENYVLRKWKASQLDAGHFVEAVRRILEQELTGSHTPVSKQLSNFSDTVIKAYENAPGDESFRMLIPRALKSIYNIRNKRGVGHIAGVSPNEMDSTYILHSVKWVLGELVRLASGLSISETQSLLDAIVERRMELLWKHDGATRVLDSSLDARDQVLVLLYDSSPLQDEELRAIIEYKNTTNFKKILSRLHAKRLIEYRADGKCLILPPGVEEAEEIARQRLGA